MSSLPINSVHDQSSADWFTDDKYNSTPTCVTSADPYTRPADMPLFAFLTFITIPSRIPFTPYKIRCPGCAAGFYDNVLEAASHQMSTTFAHSTFRVNPRFTCYTQDEFEVAIRRAIASNAATR